jgi:hypothetical protein
MTGFLAMRVIVVGVAMTALAGCARPPKVWYNALAPSRSYYADATTCNNYASSLANAPFIAPNLRAAVYLAQQQRCLQSLGWELIPKSLAEAISARQSSPVSASTPTAPPAANAPSASSTELLLFGGAQHNVFLGCLTCNQLDSRSVFNSIGAFGSRLSATSILNSLSEYGSSLSSYSACNTLATDPPIVVDARGNVFGRLTLNTLLPGAISDARVVGWLKSACAG